MRELMTKSLAQIVTSNHRAASVFEKYQLDFCCNGKRTLEQACQEKDLGPDEILAELTQVTNTNSCSVSVPFDKLTLTQLTDFIIHTHHSYVKKEMPAILNYLEKVSSKHGERHPEMIKVFQLFSAVKEEMELHMQKEELVLFPRIKDIEKQVSENKPIVLSPSYILAPVTMMEQEHEHAGSMLAEIRKLTNQFTAPPDACTTYKLSFAALEAFEKDLHQHVHLENNILFPKALKLFDEFSPGSLN